jgi:hypothetical protein
LTILRFFYSEHAWKKYANGVGLIFACSN